MPLRQARCTEWGEEEGKPAPLCSGSFEPPQPPKFPFPTHRSRGLDSLGGLGKGLAWVSSWFTRGTVPKASLQAQDSSPLLPRLQPCATGSDFMTRQVKCCAGHSNAPDKDQPMGTCLATSRLGLGAPGVARPLSPTLPTSLLSSSAPFHHAPNVSQGLPLQHHALSFPLFRSPTTDTPRDPRNSPF
jgi:hypothetical protein